jgi:hypothetical protein
MEDGSLGEIGKISIHSDNIRNIDKITKIIYVQANIFSCPKSITLRINKCKVIINVINSLTISK